MDSPIRNGRPLKWIPFAGLLAGVLSVPSRAATTATILAGGETEFPSDTPSGRLDTAGTFGFVGALAISSGGGSYRGSAVALSPEWVLTAGHNADLNDDGMPDTSWIASFHLPGYGVFTVSTASVHPAFSGFANPSVNDDLALLRLSTPLPAELGYPLLGSAGLGDLVTMVGFGRSGYGSYGYTSSSSLTDRRFGSNVIDWLLNDDDGGSLAEVFRYDFDDPSSTGLPGGSLGNDVETIIGPGDSGGPALKWTADGWAVVGINTFTEGYGGRFGDTGGGVLVDPYRDWIQATIGIPEPSTVLLSGVSAAVLLRRRKKQIR